jgi:murein DD-endopeptidase MepM/ murein hydrolase activator NlpD
MRNDLATRTTARSTPMMLLVLCLSGCGGGDSDENDAPPITDDRNPAPSTANTVVPRFYRPFQGVYPVLNLFDHDRPLGPAAQTGGYQLTWRGERAFPDAHNVGYDSHTGIDWIMPEGTPLLAMADGLVLFAGETAPAYCVLEDRIATTLRVTIRYLVAGEETFSSVYTHMGRVDVAVGDQVTAGQQVGLSGATGCVGAGKIPHLHMEIYRVSNTNNGHPTLIDPYGWQGSGTDPWSQDPNGAASVWLWQSGEAPSLQLR